MAIKNTLTAFLCAVLIIFINQSARACSMYKVTADGKTMVGCNEDAWRTTPHIWFVNAKNDNELGACFTGSRQVGKKRTAPQSGMNESGLVFSRLVAYYPINNIDQSQKKQVPNEVDYLTSILQQCKTVDEVKEYIEQYDHSIFIDDVYIYIDKSGEYLIVEPYNLIKGNDASYVLANFCPSITDNQTARKQARFKDGEDFIKNNGIGSSLDFCKSMSEEMHVCRDRNGDGTLLTSIWDTKEGSVNLYFYHDYSVSKQFILSDELAKGDHILKIESLFPANNEFERLKDYKTPFNVNGIRVTLAFAGMFLLLLSLLHVIGFFKKRRSNQFNIVKLGYVGLNIFLFPYLFILATNIGIFYFDAPYKHYGSPILSLTSYMPFALILGILPISYFTYGYMKKNQKSLWSKSLLIINSIVFLILIVVFAYWGLFDVFNKAQS